MGKKSKIKQLQKKIDAESDDEFDGTTMAGSVEDEYSESVAASTAAGKGGAGDSGVNISEAVEMLSEKRSSTRETGLESLITHFQSSFGDASDLSIEGYQDTLTEQMLRMIRRPNSVKEGKLCIQLLCLLALYNGPEEDDFLNLFERPLQVLVDSASGSLHDLSGPALSCLALISFVCGGVDASFRVWGYCQRKLFNDKTAVGDAGKAKAAEVAVRAAAADAWALLATLRSGADVLASCRGDWGSLLQPLNVILTSGASSIEAKVSAGKCLAYMWELADEASPGLETADSGLLLCDDPEIIQETLNAVKTITKESSKRISKKDRKEQRAEFRDIEEWLLQGEAPSDSLRVQGAVLEIKSFGYMRLVEALKEVLGSGFHSSLRMFEVVRDMLGVEHMTDDMDGAGEDRRVEKGSSLDKSRSNYRKQDRRSREMNAEMYEGDED
ncbi:interferon-related developmental regulator-domain-containing protein [Ochromonadaceae sp. CCMP2298]|nr:interferon-related developmental regulator-domain-containing protein [Ochromonadaceae sp. CCMP2298]|mmetsp:Transcript_33095/g.72905  ORF Transcript_33095/g.72905 Transcript_33095/m.72905 type:complete len:442 (-) Transcript_33095:73-1398(-)